MVDTGARHDELGDQAGSAGLMGGPDAVAGVAMKILVEEDVIAEVRVGGKLRIIFQRGPLAGVVFQEEPRQFQIRQPSLTVTHWSWFSVSDQTDLG
jgi:hypothetical protein